MKLPRLLLVEDDASIRRFVGMALEDSAIEVVPAPSLKDAVRALRSGPFDVVLCDLMLPDGNGLDLLRALAGADSPSPGARRVAFSAGVSAEQRQHLRAAGVHGVLGKPASLAELLACVQEALAAGPSVPEPAASPQAPMPTGRAAAVAQYFGGHQGLYDSYAAQCREQFAHDAAQGEAAAAALDLASMRRLAHSLKTVLLTLGHGPDAALALAIENAAASGQADAAWAQWPHLQARLHVLAGQAPCRGAAP